MKELNVTEAQLRSWQPRRPAAGLKQKILSNAAATPTVTWRGAYLPPTLACLMLTLMAFNHGDDGLGQKTVRSMVGSNQSAVAYAAGGEQTAQNHLASITFDWTNHSGFKSIIGFTQTTNFSN